MPTEIAACSVGDFSRPDISRSPHRSPTGSAPARRWISPSAMACASCCSGTATAWGFAPWTAASCSIWVKAQRIERTRALLARLAELGIVVLPKFAADEFGVANVYCVGGERGWVRTVPDHGHGGRARRRPLDREQALRKALVRVRRRPGAQAVQPRAAGIRSQRWRRPATWSGSGAIIRWTARKAVHCRR